MPEHQGAPATNSRQSEGPDFDIVVEEPALYPWPDGMGEMDLGKPADGIRYYFQPFLRSVRSIRKNYDWYTFYIDPETGKNHLEGYPEVTSQLERLFMDELGTKYSPAQYQLLMNSQIVVVAVCKMSHSIAGYFSSSYFARNTIPGVAIPVTFGNHGVIASNHQQFAIGVTMGAITILHGQRLRDSFRTIACVLRTNNKHILNPLRQTGVVYRSDQLAGDNLSEIEQTARAAIKYMHEEVFQLSDIPLPFDKPLKIEHRFDDKFTIQGVEPDEIIYICAVTSLSKCIFKLFARRPRRKKRA